MGEVVDPEGLHNRSFPDATEVSEHPVYDDDEDETVLTTESLLSPPARPLEPHTKRPGKIRRIRVPHLVVAKRTAANECRAPLSSVVFLFFILCALLGTIGAMSRLRYGVMTVIISCLLILFELIGELCKCRSMGLGRMMLDHSCRTALYFFHNLIIWSMFESSGNGLTLVCAFLTSFIFLGSLIATLLGASAPASLHCWDCRISRVPMLARSAGEEAEADEDPMNEV